MNCKSWTSEDPQYKNLDPRQYHGSVYGIVAAQRGYLRPTGVWNFEEVTVKGSNIKVELNGTVILDTDVSKVHEYMANHPHPGQGSHELSLRLRGTYRPGLLPEYRNQAAIGWH